MLCPCGRERSSVLGGETRVHRCFGRSTGLRARALQAVGLLLALAAPVAAAPDNFESPPVHPVERSPDGTRLFVTHLADARLIVFDLTGAAPARIAEVPVGLEPVTVRARSNDEVWVVNHVSDSISLVDVDRATVVRTLWPGDEPTDVVFASGHAFVSVSQEDKIRIYDLADLDAAPIDVPLDASDPRSLAVSRDGSEVYVCAFDSQNETTVVPFKSVMMGGGLPPPSLPMDPELPLPPKTALIVKHDGAHWVDEIGRSWDTHLPYRLLDHDVFAISTSILAVTRAYRGVGTTLFNMAVDPTNGRLWITNQEARNHVRFEPVLRGQFLQNRVSLLDPLSGAVTARHLNEHIDYDDEDGSDFERAQSLSLPLDLVIRSDGSEAFVVAFGSHRVGVIDDVGVVNRRIEVGQGPAGLALDEQRNRLYVYNRFSSTLSVVDLTTDATTELPLGFVPESPLSLAARHLLYDGEISSAHGDLSCGSCHLFGGMDGLAWDLGDPRGAFIPGFDDTFKGFHPMKGPMITQSLKSLDDTEPFHWRGERIGFLDFLPAFQKLMGRPTPFPFDDFSAFVEFLLTIQYPPNPNQNLDGTMPNPPSGPSARRGEALFLTGKLFGENDCVACHTLPTGESGQTINARMTIGDQDMKVPQLRNMYEKTRLDRTSGTSVRGFGYTHDGVFDSLVSFLRFLDFDFRSDLDRADVAAYLLAFDTGTPAAVGAQWTTNGSPDPIGEQRLETLIALASSFRIGLVAKGPDWSQYARGWSFEPGYGWVSDREGEDVWSTGDLRAMAAVGRELTFTAVVAGTEIRLGIDHDLDGYRDRDEWDLGSDPSDPGSIPSTTDAGDAGDATHPRGEPRLALLSPNPARGPVEFRCSLPSPGKLRVNVVDVQGRIVRELLDEPQAGARVRVLRWDLRTTSGERTSRGIYFVRMESAQSVLTRRIVIAE